MKGCIGLDTNVLARYYVDDAADAEAAAQRARARALMESGRPLAVCKTVLLELEWVLRGYYGFARADVAQVFAHVMAQPGIRVEDRATVERALAAHAAGLDFAMPCTMPATPTVRAWPPSTTAASPAARASWGWCRRCRCRRSGPRPRRP